MSLGADVVALSLDKPFTAGRARNLGFRRLTEIHPQLQYVQFVDGDCEIAPAWLHSALAHLQEHAQVAIVCGRRKERHPEHSVYNAICDIEWDTPVGEANSCGGDFLVRAPVFRQLGGFNESLIAGEEPEMCFRLRKMGWRIHRLDQLMTLHDAAMSRFGQWVKRASRAGYAYAARAALHWRDASRYCWRENARIATWALFFPVGVLLAAITVSPWFLTLLAIYPVQYLRVLRQVRATRPQSPAAFYSLFVLLGKWPELYGQLLFLSRWLRGREQRIIEYK